MIMVLFFHSYDLILLGDSQEFVKKFLEFEANMVFSAEGFCWPDRWLKVSQVLLPQFLFLILFVCLCLLFFYFWISKHVNCRLVALLTVFIQTWLYTATKCTNKHVHNTWFWIVLCGKSFSWEIWDISHFSILFLAVGLESQDFCLLRGLTSLVTGLSWLHTAISCSC